MRRRRWAVAGMVALALAVGGAANAVDDHHLATGWHTVIRGAQAEDVTVGNFQVHVHGAVASGRLEDLDMTSPGVFVLVDLSYATTDEWSTPEEAVLLDGAGREFTEPSGFGSAGRAWIAGPDIWYRGALLFEVPADTVDDLTLEIRPEGPVALVPATVLRVPLTVTTTSDPLPLERPTVLGEGER